MSDTKLLASGVTKTGTYPAVSFAAGSYLSVTAAMNTTGEYSYAEFDVLDAAGNVIASGEASGNAAPTVINNLRASSASYQLRVNDVRGGSLNVSASVSNSAQNGSIFSGDVIGGDAGGDRAGGVFGVISDATATTTDSLAAKGGSFWQQVIEIPTGVDAVRVALYSDVASGSAYAGSAVFVQTTDASGAGSDLKNPYSGGVAQAMQRVTFNGANSPTYPNSGSAAKPIMFWSDWIPVIRQGNGTNYIIVRNAFPAAVTQGGWWGVYTNARKTAWLNDCGVKAYYGRFPSADPVAAASQNNVAVIDDTVLVPCLVEYASSSPVISIAQYGDSTRAGQITTGLLAAIDRYSRIRSKSGKLVNSANFAIPGQSSNQYLARLKSDVASGLRFNYLVWQVVSPNSGHAPGVVEQQIRNTYEAIQIAESVGAKVILDGPFPMTAAANVPADIAKTMTVTNDFLNRMENAGYRVIRYPALHDPLEFGKWIPAYNASGDGLHQNDLATTEVIVPTLFNGLDAMI